MPSPLSRAEKCVSYVYVSEREPGGGWTTEWQMGPEFMAQIELDSSVPGTIAASSQGVINLYNVRVHKDLNFSAITYFSREYQAVGVSDNPVVFRITTDPNEQKPPEESTLNFKQFSAAKSSLPTATSFPPVEG